MNDLYDVPEFLTQEFTIVTLDKEPTNIQEGIEVFKMEGQSQPDSPYILSLKGINTELKKGDVIAFSEVLTEPRYRIKELSEAVVNGESFVNIQYEDTEDSEGIVEVQRGFPVYKIKSTKSSCVEVPVEGSESVYNAAEYELADHTVANFNVFADVKNSKPFIYDDAKLKIFAKSPGPT